MVTTSHSQNYKIPRNIIEKGDEHRTPSEVRILLLIIPFHSTPKKVRMTANHPTISNARLATFKNTKFLLELRNITLPNTTI
jgi:hypothetical protein